MKKTTARTIGLGLLCIGLITMSSCSRKSSDIAVIWTDQAEFASYAELFNHSQSKFRIVVEYKDNPAEALIGTKQNPDVVIGPWLKGEKARSHLIPIDYLFNELRINSKLFYQPLLELGNIHGRQYLLPVSFNLPALIFSLDKKLTIANDYSLDLDQIQTLAGDYNALQKGIYSRMGFSPRWDTEFLYLTALLYNTRFEEGPQLFEWNQAALNETVKYLRNWTKTINTSTSAEDDFKFKYLYDPPYKLVTAGRNLFSYIASDDLFVLPPEKIQNIDFRWISKNSNTPVNGGIIYLGICKKARHLEAAEAFLSWFFYEKTQKELLERSRAMGTMERTFGISGGFSALKPVNEKFFPLMYPSLLGHLPPANSLAVPRILPNNWDVLKKAIVIPYLIDAVSAEEGQEDTVVSLSDRVSDWIKTH